MPQSWVTVATYSSLTSALTAWDRIEHDEPADDLAIIDAALVEADSDTIREFHRFSLDTYARGAVAGAVIGLLQPPSIVTGAVAGGVGGHVLIEVGHGLSRAQVKELGEVLDSASIALVAVCAGEVEPRWDQLLGATTTAVTVGSTLAPDSLRRAFDADAVDEATPD